MKQCSAEFLGTSWLALGRCGSTMLRTPACRAFASEEA